MSKSVNQNDFSTSLRAYGVGFLLCALVTLASFATVMFMDVDSFYKIAIITFLAAVQVALQSFYFLHLGQKTTPKWNMKAYLFTIMSVSLIVLGSLWVMANLNYNMSHDMQNKEQEIIKDELIQTKEPSH